MPTSSSPAPTIWTTPRLSAYAAEDRRITVISASGEVLYDSASPGLQHENHLLRPEVAAAQRTGEGYAVRRSDTLGRQVHYCAVRMDNGSVLRVSVESASLLPPAGTIAWQLALMLAVLTGLAVLLAVILTRKILKPIYALASDGAGLSAEEGRIYPELRPFVREIRTQRDQILAQMRKLEEEENRLQVIIRHMTEGLVVLDESGRIQLANESAHRLLELPDGCEGTALAEHVASPELLGASICSLPRAAPPLWTSAENSSRSWPTCPPPPDSRGHLPLSWTWANSARLRR